MNDADRKDFNEAIDTTTELFKRRRTAEDWVRNIEEGSKSLKTGHAWKHYYAWLANPQQYNEEEVNGLDIIDTNDTSVIKEWPKCMVVETVKNGHEIIINVVKQKTDDEKDEKSED